MTKIDFYILSSQNTRQKETSACKLINKVYNLQHRVYVHTASAQEAKQLDELLWTFRQDSFVPHEVYEPGQNCAANIVVGYHSEPPPEQQDVMVNLSTTVPLFFGQFERVAEFVTADDPARQQGRQRYKFYKDRGYDLKTHELSS